MTGRKSGISIRKQLIISYLFIAALVVIVGIVGIYNIHMAYYRGKAGIQGAYYSILWFIIITMAIAVIAVVAFAFVISNSIVNKLQAIQNMARRISDYNISHDIAQVANDEFGKTIRALNESQFMIRTMMEDLIEGADTISDTGEELSHAVRKAEQRVEQANMKILESGQQIENSTALLRHLLSDVAASEGDVSLMNKTISQIQDNCDALREVQEELNNLALYLEQIGITTDYQNENANKYRKQVTRFKV